MMWTEITEGHLRREKDAARKLRRSPWWQNQLRDASCHYCGADVTPKTATMDHVLPISRGGRTTRGNVVVSCKSCNTKKQDLTPVEWQEWLDTLS